jgi:hypothetical protein
MLLVTKLPPHPLLIDCVRLLGITQAVGVLEEDDVPLVSDVLTHPRTPPCGKEDVGIVVLIMVAHYLANRLCCFSAIVKGDSRAIMVRNVGLNLS